MQAMTQLNTILSNTFKEVCLVKIMKYHCTPMESIKDLHSDIINGTWHVRRHATCHPSFPRDDIYIMSHATIVFNHE